MYKFLILKKTKNSTASTHSLTCTFINNVTFWITLGVFVVRLGKNCSTWSDPILVINLAINYNFIFIIIIILVINNFLFCRLKFNNIKN